MNCNMAQAGQHDSDSSEHESDISDESQSEDTEEELGCQQITPCKYYNKGNCRDGDSCRYSHVCMYALSGKCRYGAKCKLKHPKGQTAASPVRRQSSDQPHPKLTDGSFWKWQLNDGSDWKDIENDHVIEAQFCLPHTKSIKIYNTPYGAVTIDFTRMRVYGKDLKVRRLDDGKTEWLWYCILHHGWIKYGDKDSKGNSGPVKSSDIERQFQMNPGSSFTFNIGANTFVIKFKEMEQISNKNRKRKVARRPVYRQQQAVAAVSSALQNMSLGKKPQWQFEGKGGAWHTFKNKPECSVSSDDIEVKYQQQQNSMAFKVNGQPYKLDFTDMTQINLTTKNKRKVRRVLI